MVFILNPLTAALSLQFSSVYYIVLLSTLAFLWLVEKGRDGERKINCLFFTTGILTAYLDLLTYPLVPFGILLTLYLIFSGEKIQISSIKAVFQKVLLWGAGYGGMWGGKWLAGSILTKRHLFADALHQISLRTSAGSYDSVEEYSRLDALFRNIGVLLKWPFFIGGLAGGVFLVFWLRQLTFKMIRQNALMILFLTLTAVMPAVWISITAGHSYIHYWFTYKEFAISVFAVMSLGIYLKNQVCD